MLGMGLDGGHRQAADIVERMVERGDDGLRIGAGREMAERAGADGIADRRVARRVERIGVGLRRRQADARWGVGRGKAIIAIFGAG